jgi:hypothetical protein
MEMFVHLLRIVNPEKGPVDQLKTVRAHGNLALQPANQLT